MLGAAIDTALDLAVVPGYTSIGPRVRRRVAGWEPLPRVDGRTVVVTGATSGIGWAAAAGFAGLGARVVIVARDAGRGERARDAIAARTGADVRMELGDVSSVASMRALADRLPEVDVLVHNAGVLPPERTLTAEGVELTFATNVLGPFTLTRALESALAAGAPARVIWVSSGGMYTQRLNAADLQSEDLAAGWDGTVAYARAKRAEVVLAEQFAERLAAQQTVVHAMHPGWVATPGVEASLPRFNRVMGPLLRTPEEGADTIVWLGSAAEPGRRTGGFWHDRRTRPTHLLPRTRETPDERAALWAACERLAAGAA